MSFLQPLGLLGLIAVPIIIIIYTPTASVRAAAARTPLHEKLPIYSIIKAGENQ